VTSSRVNIGVALDEKNRSCCEAIVEAVAGSRVVFLEATATRASRDAALRDARRVIVWRYDGLTGFNGVNWWAALLDVAMLWWPVAMDRNVFYGIRRYHRLFTLHHADFTEE